MAGIRTGQALQATVVGPRPITVSRVAQAPARTEKRPGVPRVRGWLPSQGAVVTLLAALGLVLCAYCEDLSRETLAPNPWIFWAGIILIVAPICYRLTALSISSRERVLLVVIEGLALYLATSMRSPYGFSLTDEFMHAWNINHIIATHHLYSYNPLLSISAHFPGLEAATSAIAELTGMSSWGSALILIAAARVALMLTLYALFTAVSSSARVGSLGAALFAANSQFLFFEGQFAYESLALPLLLVALTALAERQRSSPGSPTATAWGGVTVLTIIAVVPTHHLTAYVMMLILWMLCLFQRWLPRPLHRMKLVPGPPMWPFALMATVLTVSWLIVVASQTVGYLSPEIGQAFTSSFRTLTGDGHVRGFFSNGGASVGSVNLPSEEAVSFLEPVLLLLATPFGLYAIWKKKRLAPFVALCALMAIAYLGLSAMRAVPSAWEVGNRGAEFAFFGFAFVIGATTLAYSRRFWRFRSARVAVAVALGLCVVGGGVAGYQANARLALPLEIKQSHGPTLYSEAEQVGRWFATQPRGRVVADDTEALLIGDDAGDLAYFGYTDNADAILSTPSLAGNPSEVALLKRAHIRYVVVDLRKRSQQSSIGAFFNLRPPVSPIDSDYSQKVVTNWDPLAARIYDSGDVVVFDLDRKP